MTGEPATRPWTIRAYQPGDEAGILDLARLVFAEQPPDRFSLPYWRWEFVANADGPARLWVADDHGTVVGHYAIIPRAMRVGAETRLGSIVVDVMTHPAYRMQGMFARLGQTALPDAGQAGIEFSFGFPIREDVMPGHLKTGWRHLFDIPILVRPLKFRSLVGQYVRVPGLSSLVAGGAWAGYTLAARPLLRRLHRGAAAPARVTVRQVTTVDDRFDHLWQATRDQFPIMGARTGAYLDWRYAHHPYHTYRLLAAESDDQLLGYIVLRTGELLGLRCGLIVDLLARSSALGCVDALLDAALREFAGQPDLDLVGAMMTRGGPYWRALLRHGFLVAPKTFWFILHTNNQDATPDTLVPAANWYLTWGDTDVI